MTIDFRLGGGMGRPGSETGMPFPNEPYDGRGAWPWYGGQQAAIDWLGTAETVTNLGCSILSWLGYDCDMAGLVAAKDALVGPSDPRSEGGTTPSCPEGYVYEPASGECLRTGTTGTIERALPGGDTGTLADVAGEAVLGAFGKPALMPSVVGNISRADGTSGPILKCRRGYVLGTDNLCYAKGTISRMNRKWKPAPKPPMTAADAKALRRIGTLQKKIKGLASAGGMSCRKR